VKATVKQIIKGKAAPKLLKKQSAAVATKDTQLKIAPAGMAMYQESLGHPRLSLRPEQLAQ
jgi:hypothetical protein